VDNNDLLERIDLATSTLKNAIIQHEKYAESGHITASEWYRDLAHDVSNLLDELRSKLSDDQEEVAATYPVSDSVLIYSLAEHTFNLVNVDALWGWSDIVDNDRGAWLDEASRTIDFLRSTGWTSPTI